MNSILFFPLAAHMYICPICYMQPNNTTIESLGCGHLVCGRCVSRLRTPDEIVVCPFCKEGTSLGGLRRVFIEYENYCSMDPLIGSTRVTNSIGDEANGNNDDDGKLEEEGRHKSMKILLKLQNKLARERQEENERLQANIQQLEQEKEDLQKV